MQLYTGWLKSKKGSPRNSTTSSKLFFSSWYICRENTCKVTSHCQLFLCLQAIWSWRASVIFLYGKNLNRAVIRFFVLKCLKAKEIYEQLLEVYKESSPFKRTVEFWAGEFKRGRTRLEDDPREARPETIDQVHNIVSEEPSLTKREIANAIGISDERWLHILLGELHMKKLFGKCHTREQFN